MGHKIEDQAPLLLTADQVARLLGLSRSSFCRRVADHTLAGIPDGKITGVDDLRSC